jgi:hypothetical protein
MSGWRVGHVRMSRRPGADCWPCKHWQGRPGLSAVVSNGPIVAGSVAAGSAGAAGKTTGGICRPGWGASAWARGCSSSQMPPAIPASAAAPASPSSRGRTRDEEGCRIGWAGSAVGPGARPAYPWQVQRTVACLRRGVRVPVLSASPRGLAARIHVCRLRLGAGLRGGGSWLLLCRCIKAPGVGGKLGVPGVGVLRKKLASGRRSCR